VAALSVKGMRLAILRPLASAWARGSVSSPQPGGAVDVLEGWIVEAEAAVASKRQVNCRAGCILERVPGVNEQQASADAPYG
jgi:hypothetical protein